jgi:hypothetical protein
MKHSKYLCRICIIKIVFYLNEINTCLIKFFQINSIDTKNKTDTVNLQGHLVQSKLRDR